MECRFHYFAYLCTYFTYLSGSRKLVQENWRTLEDDKEMPVWAVRLPYSFGNPATFWFWGSEMLEACHFSWRAVFFFLFFFWYFITFLDHLLYLRQIHTLNSWVKQGRICRETAGMEPSRVKIRSRCFPAIFFHNQPMAPRLFII